MSNLAEVRAVVGTNSWGSAAYEKVLRGSAVDDDTLRSAISAALARGLTVFDTAQDYGLGKGQKMVGALCPPEALISAKYTPMTSAYKPAGVLESLVNDLQDFKRDHVDVYWLHLPNALEENLREMAQLYHVGLVSNIGVSNFDLEECKRAKAVLDEEGVPLYGVQNHYSLIARDWEKEGVLAWCQENGVSFWAWAVLEEGILVPPQTGEKQSLMKLIFSGKRRKLAALYAVMKEIGAQHGLNEPQVAMAFVANKGIVPICGCRKPYQAEQLANAVEAVLSTDEMSALECAADAAAVKVLGADMFRFAVRKKK